MTGILVEIEEIIKIISGAYKGQRTQLRKTIVAGEPVNDSDWTTLFDSGPIGGTPTPVPIPVPAPIPVPTPVPVPPPAVITVKDLSFSTASGTDVKITLEATGDPIHYNILTQPTKGQLLEITFDQKEWLYRPNAGASGMDEFNYSATGANGQTSLPVDGAFVTVIIGDAPPAPVPIPAPTPVPPVPTPIPTPIPSPIKIMGVIAVQNLSTDTTDADVQKWMAALKTQCDRDVYPIWGNSIEFVFVPKAQKPPVADWYAVFLDTSDSPGALAYHDVGPNGEPISKIFTKTERQAGESPSVGFSHEIIECIGDPSANQTLKGLDPDGKPCLMFQELADPVESSFYDIDGVTLSDFVTPDWFNETPKSNFMDFLRVVPKQFQLAAGGYEEVSYDNGQTWTEIDKASTRAALHRSEHSRHALYKKRHEQRVKSTFEVDPTWDVRIKK